MEENLFYIIIILIVIVGGIWNYFRTGGTMEALPKYEDLDAPEFLKRFEEDDCPRKTLIDVRTDFEYDTFHLPDALKIDFYSPNFEQNLLSLEKKAAYYVYCRNGNRSLNAVKKMDKNGFKKIIHMKDGIDALPENIADSLKN
jgi:rhodanese-related sulfurtransferase